MTSSSATATTGAGVHPFALHHSSLTVSDLDRSIAFYRDLLGMRVAMTQEKEGGYLAKITGYPDAHIRMAQLELSGGGHRVELFQYLNRPDRTSMPEHGDVGGTHICFLVDDIHSLFRRLVEANVDVLSEPIELESGANRGGFGMYLRDPDGYVLELFQAASR
jgi:catechol 2,3-dioxygenase-like lactoylglutathione lyase family enzyme